MFKLFNKNLIATKASKWLNQPRTLHLTAANSLKTIEIVEDKQNKLITIEGKYIDPAERFGNKVLTFGKESEEANKRPCAFCELEKRDIYVQHTDVLVLRQFLKDDGEPLDRKITGLCRKQQRKLLVLAKHARVAGLTLNLQPNLLDGSKRSVDPRTRPKGLKWNIYFDDYEVMKKTYKFL